MCGLLFAFLVGSADQGFGVGVGIIGVLLIWGGWSAKTPPEKLAAAQARWDRRWICARCGYQWEA
jgi:hypothetical protein